MFLLLNHPESHRNALCVEVKSHTKNQSGTVLVIHRADTMHVLTQTVLSTDQRLLFLSLLFRGKETEGMDRLNDLPEVTLQHDGSELPSLLLCLP